MTETGAKALLALRRGLGEMNEEQQGLAERLLQLCIYQMLQPLEGRESPGDTAALCAAAIRLTQEKLRAEGGEGAAPAMPEALRSGVEETLSRMRESWTD